MGNCPSCLRGPRTDDKERLTCNRETSLSGLTDPGEDNAAYASHTQEQRRVGDEPTRPSSSEASTGSTRKPIKAHARDFFDSSFEDSNDNRDKESYATQDRSHGMISGCDTVVLGDLQVYPQGARSERVYENCTEGIAELERHVQEVRNERDAIRQRYDNAAKMSILEKEALTRAYDKALCELKTEVQAQKLRHDLKMTEFEQERNILRLKHDNAMQDLGQREARRRREHDQTLDDLRQKEKRLQVEYEFDQQKLRRKMRDIEESQREKLEQLDKKEVALTKKEQLIAEKETELNRAREEERGRIIREHTAQINELKREKQALEDNYKKQISELENRINLLETKNEKQDKAISIYLKEKEAVHKRQIDELTDKKEKEVEEYAAKTMDLADNYQRLIHKQVELARQQRARDDQRQTEMDGLRMRMELGSTGHHISIREKRISQLTAKATEARPSDLSQSQPCVKARQENPKKLDQKELELTTKEQLITDEETASDQGRKKRSKLIIREYKAKIIKLENENQALKDYYTKIVSVIVLFLALICFGLFLPRQLFQLCAVVYSCNTRTFLPNRQGIVRKRVHISPYKPTFPKGLTPYDEMQ